MTFKEYLCEFDSGDLALAATAKKQAMDKAANTQTRDEFQQKMAAASPKQNDLIKAKSGYYTVVKMDRNGIHVKNQASGKATILPHGTKFKNAGKSPVGDTTADLFTVVK